MAATNFKNLDYKALVLCNLSNCKNDLFLVIFDNAKKTTNRSTFKN